MRKIVINPNYGGFGLSIQAQIRYCELKWPNKRLKFKKYIYKEGGKVEEKNLSKEEAIADSGPFYPIIKDMDNENWYFYDTDLERHDPLLVQVVEELGELANGFCSRLEIVEIEDGERYCIDEYDGAESLILESNFSKNWK